MKEGKIKKEAKMTGIVAVGAGGAQPTRTYYINPGPHRSKQNQTDRRVRDYDQSEHGIYPEKKDGSINRQRVKKLSYGRLSTCWR